MDSTFFTVYSAKNVIQIGLKHEWVAIANCFFFIISETKDISRFLSIITKKYCYISLKSIKIDCYIVTDRTLPD